LYHISFSLLLLFYSLRITCVVPRSFDFSSIFSSDTTKSITIDLQCTYLCNRFFIIHHVHSYVYISSKCIISCFSTRIATTLWLVVRYDEHQHRLLHETNTRRTNIHHTYAHHRFAGRCIHTRSMMHSASYHALVIRGTANYSVGLLVSIFCNAIHRSHAIA
jgi:hypothetical protein